VRAITLDLIADNLQLPALSAELRLLVDAQVGAGLELLRCRPQPDLRPESDTGANSADDITSASVLLFDVTGLQPGDQVQLLNDDELEAEAVSDGSSMVIADPAPQFDATALYAVSVNGDAGSAAWSIAVVSVEFFSVSGSVSGLIGSALVLQNNGTDDLAIAANGDFAFGTPLSDASPYRSG
jgi:hypothetical protein